MSYRSPILYDSAVNSSISLSETRFPHTSSDTIWHKFVSQVVQSEIVEVVLDNVSICYAALIKYLGRNLFSSDFVPLVHQ